LANGITAIRTHVDLGVDVGTTAVEALIDVRTTMAALVDIQIVGLTGRPTSGIDGADNRAVLRDALDMGVDVVGGCPHLDDDPVACTHALLEIAAEFEKPIDLHTDETLDPSHLELELLADAVLRSGFAHGATASHCVSLGVQTEAVQRRVAEKVARAGVAVVALPQTNLFLQARRTEVAPPRGLTAIAALDRAGALLCAGADNLQDPFCTVGRADPMETAALMVMAGHDTTEQAYRRVSEFARRAMGLEPTTDVLAVRAETVREAVASAPSERIVVRNGVVVHGTVPAGLL
jgi:cytosine deaminase